MLIMQTRFAILGFAVLASTSVLAPVQAAPRTWNVGDGFWLDGANDLFWTPADEPDADDTANFLSDVSVTMASDNQVDGANISGGANLFTADYMLRVLGPLNVLGESSISVGGNNYAVVPGVVTTAETVNLAGANATFLTGNNSDVKVHFQYESFSISPGAALVGSGLLNGLGGASSTVLVNDGTIVAREYFDNGLGDTTLPQKLRLWSSTLTNEIDLDGTSEAGAVIVDTYDTLQVDLPLADPFSGNITVMHESTLEFSDPWIMDGGTLTLQSDVNASTAYIEGTAFTHVGGVIDIASNPIAPFSLSSLHIKVPFTSTGGLIENHEVLIFAADAQIQSDAVLKMHQHSKVRIVDGAELSITVPSFNLDADGGAVDPEYIIDENSTLNVDVNDYDSNSAFEASSAAFTMRDGARVDINVGSGVFNYIGGILFDSAGGDPAVWTGDVLHLGAGIPVAPIGMPPTMIPTDDGSFTTYFGSALTTTITPGAAELHMESRLIIDSDGSVFFGAGEKLRLEGGNSTDSPNEILGGYIGQDFGAASILNLANNRVLRGYGTIDANVDGDGTAQLTARDGELIVNGEIVNLGTLRFQSTGTLALGQPLDTSVLEVEILAGGGVMQGAAVHLNGKPLRGRGTVLNQLDNEAQIIAQESRLTLNNPASDYDGTDNSGHLQATRNLEIIDDAPFDFHGTIEVEAARELFANGFALNMAAGSTMTLAGGKFRSTHGSNFAGKLLVTPSTETASLENPGTNVFQNGSTTNLQSDLLLNADTTVIEQGATFSGFGTILNSNGATLVLADEALVGVVVQNDGTFSIGSSPGEATVSEFVQSSTGTLEIELESSAAGDVDELFVSGVVSLDGALEVALLSGYVPDPWETFTILSSAGRSGTFSSIDSPTTLSPAMTMIVQYTPTDVQLQFLRVLSADFDLDGDVDSDDLAQWQGDHGLNGDSDADGDGDSDGADFRIWQQQFGSSIASLTVVPEPSVWLLVAQSLLMASVCNRHGVVR